MTYDSRVNRGAVSIHEFLSPARIARVCAEMSLSRSYLYLGIYKTIPDDERESSAKLFPLVVQLLEMRERTFRDVYSFDAGGVLLGHSSVVSDETEVHDFSLERLIEHGESIKQMIGNYSFPISFGRHPTIRDLKYKLWTDPLKKDT